MKIIPIITSKSDLEVPVPDGHDHVFAELTRKNAVTDSKSNRVMISKDNNGDKFKVNLKEEGEYKMEVFKVSASGGLQNISTYQLLKDSSHKEAEKVGKVIYSCVLWWEYN